MTEEELDDMVFYVLRRGMILAAWVGSMVGCLAFVVLVFVYAAMGVFG